ncbi:hypothetical protein Nepgr_021730 [Nepenthes gracilis]|uniref:Uncharacterized protein n=1 Tax=Nepenthes gracilis TaxID=150966 RepID=A0AAD3XXB6_NEPGR|nr:hypothetical protein Nepgr_021730 [Nepenthes gracilis]
MGQEDLPISSPSEDGPARRSFGHELDVGLHHLVGSPSCSSADWQKLEESEENLVAEVGKNPPVDHVDELYQVSLSPHQQVGNMELNQGVGMPPVSYVDMLKRGSGYFLAETMQTPHNVSPRTLKDLAKLEASCGVPKTNNSDKDLLILRESVAAMDSIVYAGADPSTPPGDVQGEAAITINSISDGVSVVTQDCKLKNLSPIAREVAARINALLRVNGQSARQYEALQGQANNPRPRMFVGMELLAGMGFWPGCICRVSTPPPTISDRQTRTKLDLPIASQKSEISSGSVDGPSPFHIDVGLESFATDFDFLPRPHLADVALSTDEASSFFGGKASLIDPAEDEGPPVRAVSKLENHETSTDSINLDGPLQKDVPKAHSLIRGEGSSILRRKLAHKNMQPPHLEAI